MEITEFPLSPVKEGTTTIIKCLSDEANPPPALCWNQGTGTDQTKSGRFYASMTESTLSITVNRTINQEEIGCYIAADDTKGQKKLQQKVMLSIKCESPLT